MTAEACTSACKTAGFALAGLEFGGECWCDSFLHGTLQFEDSQCAQMACSGNSAQTCGGPDRLQVFGHLRSTPGHERLCPYRRGICSAVVVTKSTPATQTRLNLIDVTIGAGVESTHAFVLTADTCPSCEVKTDVELGEFEVVSSLYPDAESVIFFNATTGESPVDRQDFTFREDSIFCEQISPATGRIGPLVAAANGRSDLWALCLNSTAGFRSDLVYSPVANHPHYNLSSCQPVWFTMVWLDPVH
ncbi:hypothetical protein DFH08DRAFT_486162 [Mycena albidolilacea]|uniref:WSC domain-containing protein n=1 Tax=Mycena albidolilacea TaxID=1033008 RepID=A0AAD6Z716_9AGAR|nr:hypothetical protein DFH08DRAFT_486162 [Mycena albidolilacea]